MEENITPYMVQAFYNLKPGGTLFIAATTSTNLPQKQIANMGFVDQTSSDHDMIRIDNGKGTTNICIYKFKKRKTDVIYSLEEMKINIEMHLC
ncbi:hypothetical protein C9374_013191 [Naegleria lovaniensis]|uniref:Uncharacterized protein n=1 Tax=Naegleria lovaniensis TaxID=51637 RepID=A0AA88KD94_NAELO|nr:uncharacterized protein C9374_013191 [Naegleria lovaniensis]KAG2372739.1 hypothetical protein C9374_013191 [Naegleria lovaniensis]